MQPEEIHEMFIKLVNERDIEGMLALYDPEAAAIERDGNIIQGRDAIRQYLQKLLDAQPRSTFEHVRTLRTGDVAIIVSNWKMTGVGPDGAEVSDEGRTFDIAKQMPDGTWRVVVDNPWSITL